jgi:subtilase family serine protease
MLPAGAEMPGTNKPIKWIRNLAPGTYEVTFRADPDNLVKESNEGNNTSTCRWTVVAAPSRANNTVDLELTSISVSPTQGPPGTNFQHTVVVKNVGTQISLGFNTHCDPGLSWNYINLAPGQSFTRTYPIPNTAFIPPGIKTITCIIEPFFGEANTVNNARASTFTVTP